MAVFATISRAQSPELLEAVRMHRAQATSMAQAEREACEGADGGVPKPPCAAAARLGLLEGYLTLADGDAAGASLRLEATRPPKGLEAFHAFYLAEALSWANAKARAVKWFLAAKKLAPAWLLKRIDLRLAELWLELGQAPKAKDVLEAAASENPTAELLYERALARAATGEPEKARADLRLVYLRFPAHPHAALAAALLERAGPLVLTLSEKVLRGQALLAAGSARGALKELSSVAPPAGSAAEARVELTRAQALFAQGKEPEARAELELAELGPPEVAAEALALEARRRLHGQDNAAARTLFLAVDARYPRSTEADEAGYLAAWLAMQLGDEETAVREFDAFEVKHASSRRRDEARWFKAWSLYRLKQYQAVRQTLASLGADFPRSALVPQARYWAARAGQLLPAPDGGPRLDVAQEYREVAATFAGSFYGLLARERLRELGEEPPAAWPAGARALAPKTPPSLKLAIELSRAGLLRDASEEVQRAVAQVGTADDALTWGHALQSLGEYGAAHALAARYLWGPVYTARQPEAVALMYPRAFREAVERACAARGLDPFLAWAIMRRESAFRPDVVSAADARGLMQLIPPTARAIAGELKEDPPDPDELYSPSRNIELGTWYLAALLERMGHPALCAASYNAGPGAVVGWVSKNGGLPLDEWVEEIPYKETRGYVKQVCADYAVYQELYAQSPEEHLSLALPTPKPGVGF